MTPLQATRTCLHVPFRISGRAARSEFWGFMLILLALAVVAVIVDRLFFTRVLMDTVADVRLGTTSRHPVMKIWTLAALVLMIPAAVRRLHDTDHRGWWLMLTPPLFLGLGWTFILSISSAMSTMPPSATVRLAETLFPIAAAAFLLAVALTIFLLACRSTPGPNRFGPNPNEAAP